MPCVGCLLFACTALFLSSSRARNTGRKHHSSSYETTIGHHITFSLSLVTLLVLSLYAEWEIVCLSPFVCVPHRNARREWDKRVRDRHTRSLYNICVRFQTRDSHRSSPGNAPRSCVVKRNYVKGVSSAFTHTLCYMHPSFFFVVNNQYRC